MGGIKNQRQHQHQHQPDVNWRVVRQGRGVSKGRDRQSTEGLQLMPGGRRAWGEGYEYSEPAISAKKVCDTFLMLSSSPFTKLSTCARSLFVSVAPRCVAVFVFCICIQMFQIYFQPLFAVKEKIGPDHVCVCQVPLSNNDNICCSCIALTLIVLL